MEQTADVLTTARLLGERPGEQHLADICALFADLGVMQWLCLEPFSVEKTREVMQTWANHWAEHGFGIRVWRERATSRVIGRGGLRRVEVEGEPVVELLYALRSEFWGGGYCTELARAVVENAFTELALPELVAFTLPTNRGSQRVMEKAGFTYERNVVHAKLTHVFYRQRREDFLARRERVELPPQPPG